MLNKDRALIISTLVVFTAMLTLSLSSWSMPNNSSVITAAQCTLNESSSNFKNYIQQSNIKNEFESNGFFEVPNNIVNKDKYRLLYKTFDNFIAAVNNSALLETILIDIEKKFLDSEYSAEFAGAPSGYRNCIKKEGKKDTKIYFQYSREYHNFVKNNYKEILQQYPIVRELLDQFEIIDDGSKKLFAESIKSLERTDPYVKNAMYGDREGLTVIMKVIRYDESKDLCTSPHYDKSGLTLILDNDDKENINLITAPYMTSFDFRKLSPPNRKFDKKPLITSAILIPGACMLKLGLNIYPTPHAVRPTTVKHRHSVIAFGLVPGMNTNGIQTTIVDKTAIG